MCLNESRLIFWAQWTKVDMTFTSVHSFKQKDAHSSIRFSRSSMRCAHLSNVFLTILIHCFFVASSNTLTACPSFHTSRCEHMILAPRDWSCAGTHSQIKWLPLASLYFYCSLSLCLVICHVLKDFGKITRNMYGLRKTYCRTCLVFTVPCNLSCDQ